jgi:hypothetical protein
VTDLRALANLSLLPNARSVHRAANGVLAISSFAYGSFSGAAGLLGPRTPLIVADGFSKSTSTSCGHTCSPLFPALSIALIRTQNFHTF